MNRTAAVIILFNPDDAVLDNILSFYSFVDQIYLWQNSIINPDLASKIELLFHEKLHWCGEQRNKGIGHALNFVLEQCRKSDIDWVLTMDQDSQFTPSGIISLKGRIGNIALESPIALVSANHVINDKPEHKRNAHYHWVMMSGNFIKVKFSINAGGFNESMFIDGVDIDFCFRLRSHQYVIEICEDATLVHNLGDTKDISFLGYKTKTTNHGPLRLYYIFRNYPKIILNNACECRAKLILIKFLLHKLLCVFLVEQNKVKKFRMIGKGLLDFCLGRSGPLNDNV